MKDETITRIEKIAERWFLTEPILFVAYCSHKLMRNDELRVPFRTGKKVIEYSPQIIKTLNDKLLEELLKVEIIRILLKHPYQRLPPFANRKVLTQASNITINDVHRIQLSVKRFLKGLDYNLPKGLCFEEYYNLVYKILSDGKPHTNCGTSIVPSDIPGPPHDDNGTKNAKKQNPFVAKVGSSNSPDGQANSSHSANQEENNHIRNSNDKHDSLQFSEQKSEQDAQKTDEQISALWEEDEETCCDINNIIEVAEANDTWGTLSGQLCGLIKASMKIEMDYRKMLSIFKTSVLSSKRSLTRMRPNRRFGFAFMGSRYELATNLLIAVDVSGSITDRSLQHFFSVINRFFKYGIKDLDVIQFDHELKTKQPVPLKKAKHEVKVIGRGGTSFQPAADFFCTHPEYDGLIYFTDGFAPPPVFKTKMPIDVLWVLSGKREYEMHKKWISTLKRNRATYIPSQV